MSREGFARVVLDVYFDGPDDMFWKLYNARKSFRYAGEFAVGPPWVEKQGTPLYVIEYKPDPSREFYIVRGQRRLKVKSMRLSFSYTPHGKGGTLLVSAALG
ncbi:hypothetical protein [Calidithermus terrae]|uniref:hypothetical protein n=1 Tax=Calidithermus terrae TaxID=1408545 RepID=UPI0011C46536|nr:hypothetical protein [Calidithermus terrae]